MCAVAVHLLLLVLAQGVFTRDESSDVIWYPIDGTKNGYLSSQGEVYLSESNWLRKAREIGNFSFVAEKLREYERKRSQNDVDWTEERRTPGPRIVFPDDGRDEQLLRIEECERLCPRTSEYNIVCGTDFVNYQNLGALRCSQMCGKRVSLAHYGVCGGRLPLLFMPGRQ